MCKFQVRGFTCQIHFAAPQRVVFDGAAYRVVTPRVIAALAPPRLQGRACAHLADYQAGVIPAAERAPGSIGPYFNAFGVAGRARCGFLGTKHFVGGEKRALAVPLQLLLDAFVAGVRASETVQQGDTRRQLVLARRAHQRDDFGIGIENNKSCRLDVKDGRRTVGDRDHIDLVPLMRHACVDQGLEKIEAERVGLIDFLLRAAAGATEPPA